MYTSKYFRLNLLLFFIFSQVLCYGQQTYKTVFEKLNINADGCDFKVEIPKLDKSEFKEIKTSAFRAQDNLVLKPSNSEKLQKLLPDSIQTILKNYKKVIPAKFTFYNRVELDNGNLLLRENNLWNLKDTDGKPLSSLSFEYIIPDTFAIGFVGYKNGRANYYDGKNGKPLLDENYFHIAITGAREFIVQGIHGYGLIKDNKVILEPYFEYLTPNKLGDRVTYRFFNKKDRKTYILLDDLKTFILQPSHTTDKYIGDQYFMKQANLFNLKTGKKLLCEEKHGLELVSEKHQLLSLHVAGEPVRWLIDLEGNFVSKVPFQRIGKFNKKGFSIVNHKKEPFKFNSKVSQGVINSKGEWVIPPKYDFISMINDYWLVIDMIKKQSGLLDKEGKEIIPMGDESISYVKDNQFFIGTKTGIEEEGISKLVDVKTGKILKENIPFLRCYNRLNVCDQKYFVLSNGLKKNYVVDENFREIAGPFLEVYPFNGYIYCRNIRPEPIYQEKIRLDCSGKNIPFEVDNKKIENHRFWYKITDDLEYLNDIERNGYLIYKNEKVSPINFKGDMTHQKLRTFADMYIVGTYNLGYGLFNQKGDIAIPMGTLDNIRPLLGGDGKQTVVTLKDKRAAILSAEGNLIGGQFFKYISFIDPGLFKVTTHDDKIGVINQHGEWVVPLGSNVSNTGGILKVNKNGEERWFDVAGNRVR